MSEQRPYRGLTKDGKEVYGWYCEVENKSYFVSRKTPSITHDGCWAANFIEVLPETVKIKVNGQWFSEKELSDIVKKCHKIFGNVHSNPELKAK